MKIKDKKTVQEGVTRPRRAIRRLHNKSAPALKHVHKAARHTAHVTRKGAHHTKRAAKTVHHHALARPHLFLVTRSRFYRQYHDWRYHKHLHVGLVGVEVFTVLVMLFSISSPALASVTETWDFETPGNFTFDSGLEINGTTIRHKAQEYATDANTMGLWHLNETDGSTAEDASANNNDGTVTGGTFGTGNLNNSLTLDGINDHVSVPDSTSLSFSSQNTLEAWIKPSEAISANSTTQRQTIIDKGSYQLYIDNLTGKLTYEMANNFANIWQQVGGDGLYSSWKQETTPVRIETVLEHDQVVYAGLANDTTGGADLWRMDANGNWVQIGGDGLNGGWSTNATVLSLDTDGEHIYAGLGSSTGNGDVWRWDGTTWTQIGGDSINSSWASDARVNDLEWVNDRLFAALNGGQIWSWDGSTWTLIGDDLGASTVAYSLASDGSTVYVGYGSGTGRADVWKYNGSGTDWTQIGGDGLNTGWASGSGTMVYSLTFFKGKLYASLGGGTENSVWEFNGTDDWTKIGGEGVNNSWSTGYNAVTELGYDDTYLFAGLGTGSADGEVWAWNGTAWTKVGGDGVLGSPSNIESVTALTEGGSGLYWGYLDDSPTSSTVYLEKFHGTGANWENVGGQHIGGSWGMLIPSDLTVQETVSDGNYLYASLNSESLDTVMIWRYDGSNWELIGGQSVNGSWSPIYGSIGAAVVSNAMVVHNGKLYVGLGHDGSNVYTGSDVWMWDGTVWTQIGGDGIGSSWNAASTKKAVTSLTSFNGKLYAGLGDEISDAEVWEYNGSTWTRIGSSGGGWNNSEYRVSSMVEYDNRLCVGMNRGSTMAVVYCWNGTAWTLIGDRNTWSEYVGEVSSLGVYDGKLYAGIEGTSGNAQGNSGIWAWDGSTWTHVGGGDVQISGWNSTLDPDAIKAYNGYLYAALNREVWQYDGSTWTRVAGQGTSMGLTIGTGIGPYSLSTYKGKLYVSLGGGTEAQIWALGNNGLLQSQNDSWDTSWHHVAATYDGNTMRLFIDGQADGSLEIAQAMPDNSRPLLIGAGHGSPDTSTTQPRFSGQIDEVRISNTARSSFTTKPYSDQPQAVSPNSPVFTNGMVSWSEFAEDVVTNGGSVNYRLSANNGTSWMYWSGSEWATSANLSQVSSASTIHTNMATLPVVLGGGIKWQAVIQGNGHQRVTLNSVTISGEADLVDPLTNAANIVMSRSNGGASVESNGWTNGPTPYFAWDAGEDAESGLYGYCLYLGQTEDSDPSTTKGILGNSPLPTAGTNCQFIVPAANVDLATDGLIATPLATSNNPYYFYVKAIDNAGNSYNTAAGFQFRFDNTPPTNPAYLTTPSQFLATKAVNITWPHEDNDSAKDAHSGVTGLQYRIGQNGIWYGDSHTGAQDATDLLEDDGAYTTIDPEDFDALIDGNNNIYFRTWDAAGNVTSTYTTGVIKINTSSPSSPQNVLATPSVNITNSFSFSWQVPESFVGTASSLTYCYTVNTLPSVNSCTFTNPGVTTLPAGPYATQPGENTFYVVAKDEAGNINYATRGEVTFTANTPSPGIPLSMDVADISIKSSNKWRLALSWEEPSETGAGVANYRVYRSTDNASFGLIATTSGTSYVDPDLSSILYYYKVRACDSANNCGADSATVSDTPTGKFTEPANLVSDPAVTGVSTRRATISWSTDRVSDTRISYGTKSGVYFPTEFANSEQVTSHVLELNNLSAGTTYYYQAKWTDEDGNTGTAAEGSFTTAPSPTIKDVEAFDINLSTASIRFAARGATKAKIYYGKSEGFGGSVEQITSTSESTYSVGLDALDDGSKYYFKINTFDSDDNEYEGSIFSFTTPARPRISGLRFQPVEGEPTSTQKVTWTTNVPSSSVVIYSTNGQPSQEVSDSTPVTEHEVIIRGLIDDSEYTLTAQSRDASGNLAVSDAQTFKTSLDTRPPKVFDVVVDDSIRGTGSEARGQIIVSWKTDEPSTSQVAYGEGIGGEYTTRTVEDTNLVTDHLVIVSDLPTSRTFHLKAISRDKSTNAGESGDHTTIIGRASESVIGIIFNALQKVFAF